MVEVKTTEPMNELLRQFERHLAGKGERVQEVYMRAMKSFAFPDLPTRTHVQKQTCLWVKEGLSIPEVSLRCAALKSFFEVFPYALTASEQKEILNDLKNVKLPAYRTDYATRNQVDILLKSVDPMIRFVIALMFFHGMHVSKICSLRVTNFRKSQTDGRLRLVFGDKRTGKTHIVKLFRQVIKYLLEYVHGMRKGYAKTLNEEEVQRGFLLLTPRGKPVHLGDMQRRITDACKSCGFPFLQCHAFRRGCGRAYEQAGIDAKTIHKALGHGTVKENAKNLHKIEEEVFTAGLKAFKGIDEVT